MFTPETIFQRTENGRLEIYEKKSGLTQSERLVLIMVDGVAACRAVRSKVPVLAEERFNRALATLQAKDLIIEVILPVGGEVPEQLEQSAVERFLQQDPLDPVTIISYNPEDQFGIPAATPAPEQALRPPLPRPDTVWQETSSLMIPAAGDGEAASLPPSLPGAGGDDGYSTLDRAMEELEHAQVARQATALFMGQGDPHADMDTERSPAASFFDRQTILLIFGFCLVFLGGFILGRVTG